MYYMMDTLYIYVITHVSFFNVVEEAGFKDVNKLL